MASGLPIFAPTYPVLESPLGGRGRHMSSWSSMAVSHSLKTLRPSEPHVSCVDPQSGWHQPITSGSFSAEVTVIFVATTGSLPPSSSQQGLMSHVCNPSIWEVEARGLEI